MLPSAPVPELPPFVATAINAAGSMTELESMGAVEVEPHAHLMGLSVLLVGLGAFVGQQRRGPYGALAGALAGGSAVNAIRAYHYAKRAESEAKKEAIISGTYMLLSAGAAYWVYSRRPKKGE